jgi:uncharacterized SAM-binding protein YcdF (DUF218 family)
VFFLKKLLSRFFFPVPLCAGLLVLGLLLWAFTKWKKLGRGLVVAGTLLLLIFSYPLLPRFALSHLESQYPAMESRKQKAESRNLPGAYVFVLGDSFSADTRRPPAARYVDEGLKRLIEGVRLHRWLTNSLLLISIPGPSVSQAEKERVLGELLFTFGLQTNAVQVCGGAWDTEDEIAWCRRVAGTNRVIVVSGASHLPRAMVLARKHGLQAIPAPSGYLVDTVTQSPFSPDCLFPGASNLSQSERAVYEYLGLAWEWLRGAKRTEDEPLKHRTSNIEHPTSNIEH